MARKSSTKVSRAVIKRLPRYRRYLKELSKRGVEKISSSELSKLIGYTPSQIRQDLNNFGGFGQQGYGYNVKTLADEIGTILGLDRTYNMVIVGAGNLGHAIANYNFYYKSGFRVIGVFDKNPKLIGEKMGDATIYSTDSLVEFVDRENVDIGIICVPRENAQEVCDKLCFAGVKGIWNFAPIDLEVPPHVSIQSVALSDKLYALAYHMSEENKKK
ncbi:MAG: redox-sensing transcriptional repressor Rex [Eubacteriales bacterium]|nr:redox-sensing transcriptional repressor Rex [Eubacteriales bacterium]MDY3332355.1 redox-sensing transcriptional repressor Rex [Gallibacter sp.]